MAATAGRAVGLLLLIWIAFRVLGQGLTLASGGVVAFLHGVNLVFHEAGHLIFGFFGQFVGVLGGSLNQVLIPAICVVAFVRTHWRCRSWPRGSSTTGTTSSATRVCSSTPRPSGASCSAPARS